MNKFMQVAVAVAVALGLFFGMSHVHAVEARAPRYVAPVPEEENASIEVEVENPSTDLTERHMLAALVMAEAGNQDLTGKKLVVDTVLNRVADPNFPDTIEGVVYQKNQYSVVWNGQMGKYLEGREAITDDCFTAVNEELIDQVDYAAIYFNAGGWPGYGTRLYKYGDHYFESR